ncbi:hypothetical protein VTN02DRAFT_722 [Thermoascus thermophilus]
MSITQPLHRTDAALTARHPIDAATAAAEGSLAMQGNGAAQPGRVDERPRAFRADVLLEASSCSSRDARARRFDGLAENQAAGAEDPDPAPHTDSARSVLRSDAEGDRDGLDLPPVEIASTRPAAPPRPPSMTLCMVPGLDASLLLRCPAVDASSGLRAGGSP